MKLLTIIILALTLQPQDPCSLKGRVRFVTAHGDYRIRVIGAHADARVRLVQNFPDDPGEWQPVQFHEDFTVQVVASGEDFTVQYVANFPRCGR